MNEAFTAKAEMKSRLKTERDTTARANDARAREPAEAAAATLK